MIRMEGPLHSVELSSGFWLGRYEVTVGQFRRFVESTGYDVGSGCWEWASEDGEWGWHDRSYLSWDNPGYSQSSDHPVVCVSWEAVQAYIGWLNASASDSLYRLPSEAEWEYACRAGTSTRWSFGDDESELRKYVWYGNRCPFGAKVVGGKLPNPWGLYDMHGNVREWVQDRYGKNYYNDSPRVDPRGPSTGSYRVERGGDFSLFAQDVRSADRRYYSPGYRGSSFGVRLLRIR